MNLKILSREYEKIEMNNKYYVYSPFYEGSAFFIFLAALADMFYPLPETFLIPLCVEIEKGTEEVTVYENLEITGTNQYSYFIAKQQYENWKKTYYVLMNFICLLILLINLLCFYLFWKNNYNIGIGAVEICVAILTVITFKKFRKDIKMRMQYEMRDIRFPSRRR